MSKHAEHSQAIQLGQYYELSDLLSAATETGNLDAAVRALESAHLAYQCRIISADQYAELRADFSEAYPDIAI